MQFTLLVSGETRQVDVPPDIPLLWVLRDALGLLGAIAFDLKSISAEEKRPSRFEGACAGCHAWNGPGRQRQSAALIGRRWVLDPKGSSVIQVRRQ